MNPCTPWWQGIKNPNGLYHPIDPNELAGAERFNDPCDATLLLGEIYKVPRPKPTTLARTNDEGGALSPELRRAPAISHSQVELDKMLSKKCTHDMTNDEVITLSLQGKIPGYALEKSLQEYTRAIKIRRSIISRTRAAANMTSFLVQPELLYKDYDQEQVLGTCQENVILSPP